MKYPSDDDGAEPGNKSLDAVGARRGEHQGRARLSRGEQRGAFLKTFPQRCKDGSQGFEQPVKLSCLAEQVNGIERVCVAEAASLTSDTASSCRSLSGDIGGQTEVDMLALGIYSRSKLGCSKAIHFRG